MLRTAMLGTPLAIHPSGIAVLVMLLFPDGQAMLDLVDDVATGEESLMAVRGAHADPDGHFAYGQIASPVYAGSVLDAEARHGFGDDALALFDSERFECLVFEVMDRQAFIVVAHPTFERCVGPGGRIRELLTQGRLIDLLVAETERGDALHVQPPATGGMNTTKSPSARGFPHSPNSAFTATRSISGASEKG